MAILLIGKNMYSVQSLSHVRLFVTPWIAACQDSLSITNSQSLLRLVSITLVMPSDHLILCHPLLLPPSIFPSITVFSNESILHIRWPKYWSYSFSISPSNEYSGLISVLPMSIQDWFRYMHSRQLNGQEHSCSCIFHVFSFSWVPQREIAGHSICLWLALASFSLLSSLKLYILILFIHEAYLFEMFWMP